MIAAPHRAVDPRRDQVAGNRRAQQQVIDAQPGIAGKRVPEIFPEGATAPFLGLHIPAGRKDKQLVAAPRIDIEAISGSCSVWASPALHFYGHT